MSGRPRKPRPETGATRRGAALEALWKDKFGQEELADILGTDQSYVSKLARGDIDPANIGLGRAIELSKVLGITVAQLAAALDLDERSFTPNPLPDDAVRILTNGPVIFRGDISAGGPFLGDGNDQVSAEAIYIHLPAGIIGHYNARDVYAVRVVGDSMTSPEVQRSIPEGNYVALHSRLEPRRKDIVAVWIPELKLSALKVYGRPNDEVVLESYNPSGPRFPARAYPEMIVQGVYIGHWSEGRRG